MAAPSAAEIDSFITDNRIDDRAGSDLRGCPPDIQRKVLNRGDLSTVRNPSAALLARIRDARAYGVGGGSSGRSTADVENFIKANTVDDSAADSLRSASPSVQYAVIARGDLRTAKNPSSALLARIRDAQTYGGMGMSGMPIGFGGGFGGYGGPSGFGGSSGGMQGSSGGWASATEVEDFIKANEVDEKAAEALRNQSPSVQHAVISRGDLRTTRNPSSALIARIRDADSYGMGMPFGYGSFPGSGGGNGRITADVEDFIKANEVDDKAADSLRNASPSVQQTVLSRGDLRSTKNPSSALVARIRDADGGYGGMSFGGFGGFPGPYDMFPPFGFPGCGPYGMSGGGKGRGGWGKSSSSRSW